MLRMKIKLCGLIFFFFGSCIVTVRQSCRDCIGVYSITNQIEECVNLPASRFETNYGLMLLSTKELINGTTSGFIPQSQFRGYLEASVCIDSSHIFWLLDMYACSAGGWCWRFGMYSPHKSIPNRVLW